MNKIISCLIIVTLYSCAHIEKNEPLYNQYTKYISFLKSEKYTNAVNMLSMRNIRDLNENSSNRDFTKYFPVISSLDSTLAKQTGYFEKSSNEIGCLTIIGFDSSNEPTSINLEYLMEDRYWKLDYVQVVYLDSKDNLPTEATCPVKM